MKQLFQFQKAVPVWEKDKELCMNHSIEFVAEVVGKGNYILSLTGSSSYIVFVNDIFIAHGPARAAHGFYKVDELPLGEVLREGINKITIRCAGYNVNSFSYLDVPSFLCAEICLDNQVVCATGTNWKAFSFPARIQKVQRYSYQRTFAEVYCLDGIKTLEVELEQVGDKTFLKRDVPYCEYTRVFPKYAFQQGEFSTSEKETYYNGREIANISEYYKGFALSELEYASHIEYGKLDFMQAISCNQSTTVLEVEADTYVDMHMGSNQTGLFAMDIESRGDGTLFIAFDEILMDGNIDPFRNLCSSVIALELKKGSYRFVSAEPYVAQYVRLAAKGTSVTVRDFSMYEIAFPESRIKKTFAGEDEIMARIFEAAKLSFRANTLDFYMDCPHRERAGWLCDAFFTGRVEKLLSGDSVVERAFLRNFLLPDTFPNLQKGMLPMCYPADVIFGEYLSTWAMWYGVELYEYYQRTSDDMLIAEAKERMEELLAYFKGFENDMGLLQGLGGVFIDASESNRLACAHNISFPANMLYAAFLSVFGILYHQSQLMEQGANLRKLIRELSPDQSGFYRDTADGDGQKIVMADACTETCQYYAYFFHITTPEESPKLWETLVKDFGYDRAETKKYPEIAPANAFIGNYLRLDLLARYGYKEELYDNIRGYFSYMADRTGTLWEYISPTASCNHGYASHVLCWMEQLGLLK